MEGGEDTEENNNQENEGGPPAAENPPEEPPKELTPDPTPKSPTPILEPNAEQKSPNRSVTSPPKTSSLSKSLLDKVASKSVASSVGISGKIDESPEQILEEKNNFQDMIPVKGGASARATIAAFPAALGEYGTGGLFKKRSPFIHDPPQPEERRPRFSNPRTPREYIINLREELADFQESHGLPRTRDYSFLSLGLALAQETARAIYSVLLMFAELFPILAIVSLILRFALDKLIEILETPEPVPKLKKSLIFVIEMIVIVIPLYILIGSIVIPLISLIFSMFARMLRFKKGKKRCSAK